MYHAKQIATWVQAHRQEMEVFYLPPYAPLEKIAALVNSLQRVRSYFQHDSVTYAS